MPEKSQSPITIDEYISQFPADVQQILASIRIVIKEAAPEAVEKISYNMPAFFQSGSLVWFAAWKRHIALYPRTPQMDVSIPGLSAYKGTKGSVHFPLDQPIPSDLIRQIVQFRLAETRSTPT